MCPSGVTKKFFFPQCGHSKLNPFCSNVILLFIARPAMKMPQKEGFVRYSTFPNLMLMISCDA
jgi:hypothetical protein